MISGAEFVSDLQSVSVRALALGGLAMTAAAVIRPRSAAARHAVWSVCVAGMLLLALSPALPPIRARVLPALRVATGQPAGDPSPVAGPVARLAIPRSPAGTAPTVRILRKQPLVPVRPVMSWQDIAALAYLAVALGFFVQLGAGYWITLRMVRRSRPAGDRESVPVRECDHITIPMTLGWLRPLILLPQSWREWDRPKRDAALAHEREHVRRGDWAISVLAAVNRCLFWFHPLAWWMEKRLGVLAEEACDDAALLVVRDREQYARTLLDMAQAVQLKRSRYALEGIAMARNRDVRERIERVLDDSRVIGRAVPRRALQGLALGGLCTVYLVAAVRPERMLPLPVATKRPDRTLLFSHARTAALNDPGAVENMAASFAGGIARQFAGASPDSGGRPMDKETGGEIEARVERYGNGWVMQRTAAMLIETGQRIGAPQETRLDWDLYPRLSEAVRAGVRLMLQAQTLGEGGTGTALVDSLPADKARNNSCEASPGLETFYLNAVKVSDHRIALLREARDREPDNLFLNRWMVISPGVDLRDEYARILARHLNDARYMYYYGEALARRGNVENALHWLEKSVATDPSFPWNYVALAQLHAFGYAADQTKLVDDLRHLATLCPQDLDYHQLPRVHDIAALRDLTARYRRAIQLHATSGVLNYYPRLWSQELRLTPGRAYGDYARQVTADLSRMRALDGNNGNALRNGEALVAALVQESRSN